MQTLFSVSALLICWALPIRSEEINLARTSLAAVTASSVNGTRAIDNPYHGLINAFDGGNHWINNINYTYWLSDYGSNNTYAEIYFDIPVTISSIIVDSECSFTAQITDQNGVSNEFKGKDRIDIKPILTDINSVHLKFENNKEGTVKVNEIEILGSVPSGTEYKVTEPRVLPTDRNFQLAADDAFQEWLYPYLRSKRKIVRSSKEKIEYIYYLEDVPAIRVTIDRKSQIERVEKFPKEKPYSELKPAETLSPID